MTSFAAFTIRIDLLFGDIAAYQRDGSREKNADQTP